MSSNHVTIKEVARAAGVSVGLVSRILNGGRCDSALNDRINEAIARLNYVPDPYARAVRSGLRGCLGILVEKSCRKSNFWLEDLLVHLLEAMGEASFRSILQFVDVSNPLPNCRKLSQFVDGLVLIGHFDAKFFSLLRSYCHVPAVAYWESLEYDKGFRLEVDVSDGMRQLAEFLYHSGHREVGIIGVDNRMNAEESEAFLQYFQALVPEFSAERIIRSGDSFVFGQAGYHRTLRLLERFPKTSVLFYLSDCLAFGGINALYGLRLRLPDDIGVVSFDNSFWASSYMPALTSVGIDYSTLAERLVNSLIALINDKSPDATPPLSIQFYPRESVTALNGSSFS